MRARPEKFTNVAIALHWLVALAVVLAVAAGLYTGAADDAATTRAGLAVHQSIGFAIFVLVVVRGVWRLTHPAPPLPAETSRLQKIAATLTHLSLYLMLFFLPATGYAALAARGRTITVFGLFDLPNLVPEGMVFARTSQSIHENAQYVLYALVALHVGAALYHQLVLKDGVLARMWPGARSSA